MENVTAIQTQRDLRAVTPDYRPLFRKVPVDAIGASWAVVERGLTAILAKCPAEHWTARDIRRHLRQGRASLFMSDKGFVVLELAQEFVSGEPYLNVWLMWFEPNALERDQVAEWLDDVARSYGCEWWQFASPRKGWGDYLDGICEPSYTVWRRHV